jgi:hypothetical protein
MNHTARMKPTTPDLDPRVADRKKAVREKDDSRLWHPSVIEFSNGVEVSEDTLPAELWDLFPQAGGSDGAKR